MLLGLICHDYVRNNPSQQKVVESSVRWLKLASKIGLVICLLFKRSDELVNRQIGTLKGK